MRKLRIKLADIFSKVIGELASKIVVDVLLYIIIPGGVIASVVSLQLTGGIWQLLQTSIPLYVVLLIVLFSYLLFNWDQLKLWFTRRRTLRYLSSDEKACLFEYYIKPRKKSHVFREGEPTPFGLVKQNILYTSSKMDISLDLNFHIHDWAWRMLVNNPGLLDYQFISDV